MNRVTTRAYFKQEPSKGGKLFLRVLSITKPAITKEAIATANYFRTLDDIVDTTIETQKAIHILQEEEKSIQAIRKNNTVIVLTSF